MPSSASTIAMFELMGTGENGSTWGTKANVVFGVLERFGNGVTSVTMNSATKTLTTATDYSARDWHYAVFNLVSATQAANLVLPSKQKFFGVKNSATGAYTATVKTATGTGVAVRQSETAVLYNNGTDVVQLFRSFDFAADPAANGLVARTAAGSASARTITAPAAGITVSNGDGAAGNPTLVLANDLAALEGLGSTGIAVRSASDTWVQRSVAAGSGVAVTNGDGVSGNPTVAVDINGTTTATAAVATGDYLLLYDVSLGALRKAATSDVLGAVGGVTGPGSSTDNAVARFDGTGGGAIQNSAVTIDDSGNVTTAGVVTHAGHGENIRAALCLI